jgi:hypothetical protein
MIANIIESKLNIMDIKENKKWLMNMDHFFYDYMFEKYGLE